MDKVEDTTEVKTNGGQDFEEPRQLKFRGLDQPQISESDLALWEQSPPVAELSSEKDTTTANKSCEKVGKKISHCFSVSAVVVTLACIWIFFAIPQLCYFKVGICTDQIINEVSCLTAEITYSKHLLFLLYLFFFPDWLSV